MGRLKLFLILGCTALLLTGVLFSFAAAKDAAVLDLSSQNLRDRIHAGGFIASHPLPALGKIVGTKNQAFHLSAGEFIYVQTAPGVNVKPGDRYFVANLAKEVFLPGAKKKIGDLVIVPGEIVIVSAGEGLATAKIEKSHSVFFAGDLLISPPPAIPASLPVRSLKAVEGSILLSLEDSRNITEKEVVFINRGRRDGLIPGDLFYVYQTGFSTPSPPAARQPLPEFIVGELVVVSVQEETATALVTKTSQEIHVGDRVASGRK